MNLDLGLIACAKKAVAAKPRKHVTVPDVLAVMLQESHGVPWFLPTDPQFKLNMRAACRITGMHESKLRQLIVIPDEVLGWKVPEQMRGKFAKFRCESGYWAKFHEYDLPDRFYRSCSWGLGQLMGAHLKDTGEIRRFLSDIALQGLWCAGMMDDLMTRADGDLFRAYKGYNSGSVDSTQKAVIERATAVVKTRAQVAAYLKERGL